MSRSFSDPETHFRLERSDTPITDDGFKLGELTGEVTCLACGKTGENVDEIPHAPECDQRWVRSEWWVEHMLAD